MPDIKYVCLSDMHLGADTVKGMDAYLNGPVLKQIEVKRNGNVPQDVSVIFGHTHKLFQLQRDFQEYQLHERIAGLVEASKDPWRSFPATVAGEVPRRVENLQSKISRW
ncbi:MAG: hypothetical protein JO360_16765 [Acidobacteria bacterium]|nr:hypothetical protein [Acidobacteriota bacterium]